MSKYYKVELYVEMNDETDPYIGAMNYIEYNSFRFAKAPVEVTEEEFSYEHDLNGT